MKLSLPWARREHYHIDPILTRLTTCAKCGHLILLRHVDNTKIMIIDRSTKWKSERIEIYGKSCAPDYNLKEIATDGKVRFYKDGEEIKNVEMR